jgi:hypothetical protein
VRRREVRFVLDDRCIEPVQRLKAQGRWCEGPEFFRPLFCVERAEKQEHIGAVMPSNLVRKQLIPMIVDTLGVQRRQFLPTLNNDPPDMSGLSGFVTALQALTVGVVRAAIVQEVIYYSGDPVSGPYGTARDAARFTFSSFAGRAVYVDVNAPNADIFVSGSASVDLARADVIAFVAECIATISDSDGVAIRTLETAERIIVP